VVEAADRELTRRYSALPSATETFHDLVLPLSRPSADDAALLLLSMVRALESGVARGRDAQEALLTVALEPLSVPVALDALSHLRRRAIRAVALHAFPKPTWTDGSVASVLMRHGLPGTFEEMEQFLGEPLHGRKRRPWWRLW